ncbi:MAG: hypothetical protein KGH75_02985 [Rhodospirillales bacterium]|nr:hypothetical protein [Rhodospirillales bacterium]
MRSKLHRALLATVSGCIGILGAAIPIWGMQTSFAHADQMASTPTVDNAQIQQEFATLRAQIAQLNAKTDSQQSSIDKNLWYMIGKGGNPIFVSKDGGTSMSISGFMQADATLATVPHETGYSGGTALRKFLFSLGGTIDHHFVYHFVYNFASTASSGIRAGLLDAYLGYQGKIAGVNNVFLVGEQFPAFGVVQIQPGTDIQFMEDTVAGNIWSASNRQLGVSGRQWSKNFNIWYGVFGPTSSVNSTPVTGTPQVTYSAELEGNIINTPEMLLSIRDSMLFNRFNNNPQVFENFPDIQNYGANLIATQSLPIVSDYVNSPRVDFVDGRLNMVGEYYYVKTHETGDRNPTFSGWNAIIGCFLSDDGYTYSAPDGYAASLDVKHPVTQGGYGAFQLSGRIDETNLNYAADNIHGGNETNITVGFSWWPVSAVRVEVNYVKVLPIGGALASSPYKRAAPSILGMRFQLRF